MNNVTLIGNLGLDPEIFTTQNGFAITTLKVATVSRKKENDNWVDVTSWHTVKVLGKQGENAAKFLSKGKKVGINGEIQYRVAEKDGKKTYFTEILAREVEYLSPKSEGGYKANDVIPGEPAKDPATGDAFDQIPF